MQNLDVDERPAVDPPNQHAPGTGTDSFWIKKDKNVPTLVVGLPAYLQTARTNETPEERKARLRNYYIMYMSDRLLMLRK